MDLVTKKYPDDLIYLPVTDVLSHFEWLKHFDDEEKVGFILELLKTISESEIGGDWDKVIELIEDWKATANINADQIVVDNIKEAEAELSRGEGVSWEELRRKLDL